MACKHKDENSVHIFDINMEKVDLLKVNKKRFHFIHENAANLRVKIAEDFSKAVLINEFESYIIVKREDEDEEDDLTAKWYQNTLPCLEGEHVRRICHLDDNEFMMVCSQEYDNQIRLISTKDEDFKVSIPRGIEPGSFKVFDLCMLNDPIGC